MYTYKFNDKIFYTYIFIFSLLCNIVTYIFVSQFFNFLFHVVFHIITKKISTYYNVFICLHQVLNMFYLLCYNAFLHYSGI